MDVITKLLIENVPILVVGILVHFLASYLLNIYQKKKKIQEHIFFIMKQTIQWIIVIFFLLLILQNLGIPIARVWAALSAVLVLIAIGFVAFWSLLSNILCYFLIILTGMIKIGEHIELLESASALLKGRVIDLNFFYISIQEENESQSILQIPNNILFQKVLRKNKSKEINNNEIIEPSER